MNRNTDGGTEGAREEPQQAPTERLEKIAVHVPGLLYQYQQWPDGHRSFPFTSAGIDSIYGVDPQQARLDASPILELLDERDAARVETSIAESAQSLSVWHETYRVRHPERGEIWVEGEATPERMPDGSTLWHGYIHEVTERIDREREREALQVRLQLAAEVFSASSEGIIICDAQNRIIEVNDGFERITGFRREETLGRSPSFLASGRHDAEFYRRLWASVQEHGSWRGEIWNRRASGDVYAEILSISVVRDADGVPRNYIGVFSDITPSRNYEHDLQRHANYDYLTGIPNRRLLTDRLAVAIHRAQRDDTVLAVCYLDLDGFKPINDRFGHDVGDEILVCITGRLKQAMRGEETLARFGGDEFVLLFNGVEDQINLATLLERLLGIIREPVEAAGVEHCLSASIGVTLCPSDEPDPDTLIRHADQAMYRAKQSGRNCVVFYDSAQDHGVQLRQQRRERVAQGLRDDEFFVEYQPIVDLRSGMPVGAEALLRWQHPEFGVLAPRDVLPDLDGSALDREIGDWVIDQALGQLEAWKAAGLALSISINVSAELLLSDGFSGRMRASLASHPGVCADDITLEILESSALQDLETARATLLACRRLGLRLALDNFGTGYSSLGYFRELSVDFLKIDRSFVGDMLEHPSNLRMVEGMLCLARVFERRVVAEGVASVEHQRRLLELGCDFGQGFAIARPMSGAAAGDWMAGRLRSQAKH